MRNNIVAGVEPNSNFINCKQGYFNQGKYAGKMLKNVPAGYLLWTLEKAINLNKSEVDILCKTLQNKIKNIKNGKKY